MKFEPKEKGLGKGEKSGPHCPGDESGLQPRAYAAQRLK